ncbi:MAG: carbamoyltransferase HypF [Candidatus Bathyarchaeota archaeon]
MRAEITVTGIVQGVGFRPFVYRTAVKENLKGFIRNCGDATVEIIVEGNKESIKRFMKSIRNEKPPLAQIYRLKVRFSKKSGGFKEFKICKSLEEKRFSGLVIPPDISICSRCLDELRNPKDRRYNYFFITCTDCGPRYTIIEKLPYDRENTTMADFSICSECEKEYVNPLNRRFHAQTIACHICGPKVYLTTKDGSNVECKDPIRETGKLVEEGFIVAIKGNGGFHIATSTLKSEPIIRLRKVKHRAQKPFAVMAKNLEAVKTFAKLNKKEEELLTSYIRPIVLLEKSENYYLSEEIAPGLHNIGVMLPYTGLHYMLFDDVKEPAFIMTSANPPSEPIVIDDNEAYRRLSSTVDYFLLHNRRIAQRCDDSVVRVHDKIPVIIRRSRGYAPAPILLKNKVKKSILALGAEENVTGCILSEKKAFLTQYIGDVKNTETLNYLKHAITHLLNLTNIKFQSIACDLHPKFNTTSLANNLAEKFKCEIFPVQHHHAHLGSLMAEHGLEEVIGIVCDGFGYGLDGKAWGGEILYWVEGKVERLIHLQEQPMIGGDKATIYPLRMVVGILRRHSEVEDWIYSKSRFLPFGKMEAEVIVKQAKAGKFTWTTSCGRVLDAVAALLGICYERTYEGEPALKLESYALNGKDVLKVEPKVSGNIINTENIVLEIFENLKKYQVKDLAYSAQEYIGKSLAQAAIEKAEKLGVKVIGFSGGVAYNKHITSTIKKIVKKEGFKFIINRKVPAGDGGISLGQAFVASFLG